MATKCASKTLFVGNLHASLEETDLLEIFKPFGRIVECCKRWCHYGFIQFATEDEAKLAFNNLNGSRVRGRPMRIEFQRKKIRNLAALLEAEAQAKLNNKPGQSDGEERISPIRFQLDDSENVSPVDKLTASVNLNKPFMPFQSITNYNLNLNDDKNKFSFLQRDNFIQQSSKDSNKLVSQFSFDSDFSDLITLKKSSQPLGSRSINIQKLNDFDLQESSTSALAREIATNVLSSSSSLNNLQSVSKPSILDNSNKSADNSASFDMDHKSTAWFNYLLDKAAQYPTTITKSKQHVDTFSLSSSSSPISPTNNRGDSPTSVTRGKSSNADSSMSVMLYRSLNTSNTIFVQPTDVLEPLEVGDFNEYKLFPNSKEFFGAMSSPNTKLDGSRKTSDYSKEMEILVELTPPSSVSLSSSSSSVSSNNTSPISNRRMNKKLFGK